MTITARPTLADLLRGMIAVATSGAMLPTAPFVEYLRAPEDDPALRSDLLDTFLAQYMPDASTILLEDVHALDDILSEAWHAAQQDIHHGPTGLTWTDCQRD